MATAGLAAPSIAAPLRHILREQRNVTVLMGEVPGIDTAARRVHAWPNAQIDYDYLLVASGATHAYFGHDDWEQFAPGPQDARRRVRDPAPRPRPRSNGPRPPPTTPSAMPASRSR